MTCRRQGQAIAAVVVASCCGVGIAAAAGAPAKIPLDYRAYDGWNAIRSTVVSDDGRYAAYALVPEDGDPTLVVHDFTTGSERRELRGTGPVFSADGRFVVFALRAPNVDIHRALRAHKKPGDGPKNGIGILDLTANALTTVEGVKDFKLPADSGSDTLAYALASPAPEPAASPSGSPKPGAPGPTPTAGPQTPLPSASGAPSPSPSPSPDDLHKKDPATTLVIRDLATGSESRADGVTAYAIAHDGAFVAYGRSSKDGRLDALDVRVSGSGRTVELMHGAGHYKNLTFAPKHDRLAFVSDAATFADAAPQYALYQADLSGDPATARALALVDAVSAGFREAPPSEYGTLRYSKDGARLFFGAAAPPTPVPSATPDPVKVDSWNWQDRDLQSMQRKDADDERKRTFTAVAATDGTRAVRLADADVRTIVSNENAGFALGIDDAPYRKAASWDVEYEDVYAVSLADGTRRLLIRKQRNDPTFPAGDPLNEPALSPRGAFAVAYDAQRRTWFSVDTHDGKRTDLTARLTPAFYDELDDHPAAPPPYGTAGWIDGDRYVLLRDRYDIWAVDPRTGAARLLTGGIGRRRRVIFTTERTDPDTDSFEGGKPIVLHARDEKTGDQGLWRVSAGGAAAFAPQPIVMLPKAVTFVTKARRAERFALFEQSRTNRFRAAEAGAAVGNMTSAYGGIRLESGRVRESQYETGQSRIGASALFHLRSVNTPYLTIANDLDGAVPQAQGIEFFTGLRRLGKEAYLFSFDGEDHNLKGREQLKYWTVHLDEFFDRLLLGKPAPDWMTHGVDFLHRGRREIDATYYGENF